MKRKYLSDYLLHIPGFPSFRHCSSRLYGSASIESCRIRSICVTCCHRVSSRCGWQLTMIDIMVLLVVVAVVLQHLHPKSVSRYLITLRLETKRVTTHTHIVPMRRAAIVNCQSHGCDDGCELAETGAAASCGAECVSWCVSLDVRLSTHVCVRNGA